MIQTSSTRLVEHVLDRFYNEHHNFEQFKRELVDLASLERATGEYNTLRNMAEDSSFHKLISVTEARIRTLRTSLGLEKENA